MNNILNLFKLCFVMCTTFSHLSNAQTNQNAPQAATLGDLFYETLKNKPVNSGSKLLGAMDGGMDAGGGKFLLLETPQGPKIKILDVYEGEATGYEMDMGHNLTTLNSKIKYVLDRLAQKSPKRSLVYNKWIDALLSREASFIEDVVLPVTDDLGLVFLPKNSTILQYAIQRTGPDAEMPGMPRYLFDRDVFNRMDLDTKVASIFHEIVRREFFEASFKEFSDKTANNRKLSSKKLPPEHIRYLTYLLLSKNIEKLSKAELGAVLTKMGLCSEASENSIHNPCVYLNKFFDQATLSEDKILHYHYNFDTTNMICSIHTQFKDNGNVESSASQNCFTGGRLFVSGVGNFLASQESHAKINIKLKIDNQDEKIFSPALGYGGVWSAEEEIQLPNEFSNIKVTFHVTHEKTGYNYSKTFQLSSIDPYKPKAVIYFEDTRFSPIVENRSRLCSGQTVGLYYNFNRFMLRGLKSEGSYFQFKPTVSYNLEMYDQNNVLITQIKEGMNFTFPGQYIFFKAPPGTKYFKLKFEAKNPFNSQIFSDPEMQNRMYHIDCGLGGN